MPRTWRSPAFAPAPAERLRAGGRGQRATHDARADARRALGGAPCLVLALVAALATACGGHERAAPNNVVLLGIDTLRADHLGCYGYGRPTSPRMDALARESVVFEQAISQSPWTLPAFASMLTGVLPTRHGAGRGKLCIRGTCGALVPDRSTLADQLGAAGYRTAAFVSNCYAGPKSLGARFQEAVFSRSSPEVVEQGLAWLGRNRAVPTFLFLILIDPHKPYEPSAEDAAPFVDPGYRGPVGTVFGSAPAPDWTPADRRRVVDLYDGEIHAADRLVGRLVDGLRGLGLLEHTLLVIAGDHGEELLDRGESGHGHSMYEELLHVPLLVRFPGGAERRRVPDQVRTMDVCPTVLEAAGVPVPHGLDGVSLVGLARGGTAPRETGVAVSEFTYWGPELRAIRRDRKKLILDLDHDTARLFDLATDPTERTDVAAAHAAEATALRALLESTARGTMAALGVVARGGSSPGHVHVQLATTGAPFGAVALEANGEDRLRLEPSGAAFGNVLVVSLTLDGRPIPPRRLLIGHVTRPRFRFPLVLSPAEALVSEIGMPGGAPAADPRIAIQAVVSRTGARATIDPETAEQLRALGYAE